MKIQLIGMDRVINHITKIRTQLKSTLSAGMKEAAFQVERAGKLQITSGPNRAIKTGYLRASIAVTSVLPYEARVQAAAGYGIYIHEGTRYMKARPFLHDGLKQAAPEIEKIFGKRIKTLVEVV
jgi:HK97 gp10 family phage protein